MSEEISTISWGSRLKDALIGILIGIALIIGAIVLIFWNEGHSLHTAQSLDQTQKALISVPNSPINSQNNLKPVYFSGLATTKEDLTDSVLGVTLNAINLNRKVEMYQWKEHVETKTEKQMGGSEKKTKTYTYNKVWSDKLIDSTQFKTQEGHDNPAAMPLESQNQYASKVTVGDFSLPEALITQISVSQSVDLSKVNKDALKTQFNKPVSLINNQLYLGESSQTPQTGDMRVSLTVAYPQNVSVIGQQSEHTVQPYLPPAGESVLLLSTGQQSSEQMIQDAKSQNKMLAWILRLISLMMLIGGFSLIMRPISVLADVLPFLGTLIGFGTGFIAMLCGAAVWLIATSIAWFTTRPIMSIGLLLVMVVGGYLLISLRKKDKPAPELVPAPKPAKARNKA